MFVNLIDVKTDDTTDYGKTSLLLVTPKCSGKCGEKCQNYYLIKNSSPKQYSVSDIVNLYNSLDTHEAVVFAGLEPFDTFDETKAIVKAFLENNKRIDIVIYTGYNYQDIADKVDQLVSNVHSVGKTIIIKFGPYDPQNYPKSWHSDLLNIDLATSNQYVEKFYVHPITNYLLKLHEDNVTDDIRRELVCLK